MTLTLSWSLVFTILGYLTTLLLIPVVLLTKKPQASATIAWIFAIVVLPILGGVLFLLFGINRVERRAARKEQASRYIVRSLPGLSQYQLIPGEAPEPQQRRLMRLADEVGGPLPTLGNKIEVTADTNRTLGLIEQAILAAQTSLHLEYYIWQPDRTGTRLRDLLIRKAQAGVKVRFLYDSIGSLWLRSRFLKPMRDAGIEVAPFLPGPKFWERWSFNLRNHRKIVVVDGQVGFTGGMNIGDEYIGRNKFYGFWRDTHLRMQGPAVLQLQQVFAEDWYYATGEELTQPDLYPTPAETGNVTAHVIADGPAGQGHAFHSLMFAAINEAQEQITLVTSYFVPPESLLTALETAARRGVRVRLLLPGKGTYWWTYLAGRSYFDELLAAGAELYEYQQGSLHSKTLTVDGSWSLIGTPNFDNRSLMLNFEVAVVCYGPRIARELEKHFEIDARQSIRIDPATWPTRSVWSVLGENVCRLFAPVL
jgi:cardiolipin synthase